jgi:two-component system, sporulation sensor kinase D
MKLYSDKQKWKILLLFIAIVLVAISLFFSNRIVNKVAERERERVTQWADAIKKRAELVRLTNRTFNQLREKELAEMELWIAATKEISKSTPLDGVISYDLPLKIINRNNDIPVIVLDQDLNFSTYINLDFSLEDIARNYPDLDKKEVKHQFEDTLVKLAKSWEKINPSFTIEIYKGLFMTYYYSDSRDIIRLEKERDSLISAFNRELIDNADLVPVILVDSTKQRVIASNLTEDLQDSLIRSEALKKLAQSNEPLLISFDKNQRSYLYYADSPELKQLQYFPYIQFLLVGLFIFIGYVIFSTFRKAEQNQVWAGMAKETAHQLGTPLSSLMAWIELLKSANIDPTITEEMNKDIQRLTQITDRFSKIGAGAQLNDINICATIWDITDYLKTRVSKKVHFCVDCQKDITVRHNAALMQWVIENICKNAVDAMEAEGELKIVVHKQNNKVFIDITDTGKGMTKNQMKTVFEPGYTTKKRGWGLGLSLAKRIIKEYHKGKIFVLQSELNRGSTFRIVLFLT